LNSSQYNCKYPVGRHSISQLDTFAVTVGGAAVAVAAVAAIVANLLIIDIFVVLLAVELIVLLRFVAIFVTIHYFACVICVQREVRVCVVCFLEEKIIDQNPNTCALYDN